ncbi:MAG: hypothetical protein PVSMB9_02680 [Candidatus Dormibacteria bacterium]
MNSPALHHVGLSVTDIERSVAFYRDLIGLVVRERDDVIGGQIETLTGVAGSRVRIADLEFRNGQTLELMQYTSPAGDPVRPRVFDPGHTHVGVEVENVEAVHRRLVAAGIRVLSEPTLLADAGPFWTGAKVFNALDPDGITVELVQMPDRQGRSSIQASPSV